MLAHSEALDQRLCVNRRLQRMEPYALKRIDPTALAVPLEKFAELQSASLTARCEYVFMRENGDEFHRYRIPGNYEIHNTGAYVDKVLTWRDPSLAEYLTRHGVNPKSFAQAENFPILRSRSPVLDLVLFDAIRRLRRAEPERLVRLLDHGCTVAEHYDLLGVMLEADGFGSARDVFYYHGIDNASLPLAAARMLHAGLPSDCFELTQAEGSEINFSENDFDLSLSVGVVNHVADAPSALDRLLRVSRCASVLALWTTTLTEGFWATRHNGLGNYFFSQAELDELARVHSGKFVTLDHRSELSATQPNSYMDVPDRLLDKIGESYIVFIKEGSVLWSQSGEILAWMGSK